MFVLDICDRPLDVNSIHLTPAICVTAITRCSYNYSRSITFIFGDEARNASTCILPIALRYLTLGRPVSLVSSCDNISTLNMHQGFCSSYSRVSKQPFHFTSSPLSRWYIRRSTSHSVGGSSLATSFRDEASVQDANGSGPGSYCPSMVDRDITTNSCCPLWTFNSSSH
jgi:hypothetical protein